VTDHPEYLTVQGAAQALNTNRRRIWQLIAEGELHAISNPLDRRSKLIPSSELERFTAFARAREAAAQHNEVRAQRPSRAKAAEDSHLETKRPRPRIAGMVNDPSIQGRCIEDYMREHWRPQ
jgi:excisionase family DNA binding protein